MHGRLLGGPRGVGDRSRPRRSRVRSGSAHGRPLQVTGHEGDAGLDDPRACRWTRARRRRAHPGRRCRCRARHGALPPKGRRPGRRCASHARVGLDDSRAGEARSTCRSRSARSTEWDSARPGPDAPGCASFGRWSPARRSHPSFGPRSSPTSRARSRTRRPRASSTSTRMPRSTSRGCPGRVDRRRVRRSGRRRRRVGRALPVARRARADRLERGLRGADPADAAARKSREP